MHIDKIKELYQHFSIVPLSGKAPIWKNWTKHCSERPVFSKIENHKGNFGICGGFEGIEFVDIDNDLLTADELYLFISDNFDLAGFPVTKTQSGGYHIYFKCDNPKSNLKLAFSNYIVPKSDIYIKNNKNHCKLPGKKERNVKADGSVNVTLIETRGQGGQVVFYDNFIQGSIDNVPKISDEKRDELFDICISQNEVSEKEEKKPNKVKANGYSESPLDLYINDPSTVNETINLLLAEGWTTRNNIYWWRPGKDFRQSPSATFGKVGINKFYNFSSNGEPFPERESVSMVGVRAILKHNNNYSACAKELAQHYNILPKQKSNDSNSEVDNSSDDKPVKLSAIAIKWKVLEKIIKEWKLKFRYNELTNVIDLAKNNSKKYERPGLIYTDIVAEMEINRKIKSIGKSKIEDMISTSRICNIYNPITDFFKSLPKWDGVDYFIELKKYIILDKTEDSEFFFTMFRKQLTRAVKCAGIAKYINRFVFILHGPQEIGKSEFLKWLIPNQDLYYDEPIRPDDKDSILALSRYLLINLEELDGLNKKDVAKLKAFISKGTITKRVSYGKHDEKFNRISSLFGSSNRDDLLADEHNSRWLIFKVINFKWEEYTKKIDPLQIWSQAMHELKKDSKSGELTSDEKLKRDERNNSDFLQISKERELLLRYFKVGNMPMTATDVMYTIETKKSPIKVNEYSLRRELRRLFGEPLKVREDTIRGDEKKQGRYYYLSTTLYDQSQVDMYLDEGDDVLF